MGLHRPYFLDGIRANETEHARLYGPLHHNCSGNHAALLALAKTFDVDPARYLEPQLESNQLIEGAIRALAGEEPVVQEDNCGAPCFELPLSRIAAVYRALAAPSGVRDLPPRRRALLEAIAPLDAIENALARITEALIAHPQWVSAESSAARAVAQRVTSGLVVKHGGEGMLCAAHPQSGAALAFKVRDGNGRATIPSLVFAARRFGWLSEDDVEALNTHPELLLHGHRGHPIGRLRGVAPE